jgi:hypothetical protein
MTSIALWNHYKQNRKHQMDTYSRDNVWFQGVRTYEYSGGGAAVGFHAVAAYNSARSHIHFMKTLSADIKTSKRRSAAAKRAWKKRKAVN